MISVEEAFAEIVEKASPLHTENVVLHNASGRVLASPIKARRSQPGCDVSAMDGYAVKSTDLTEKGTTLKVIGESAAGVPFKGPVGSCEAVRIFTGAAVPEECNQVIIQENTSPTGEHSIFTEDTAQTGHHIRFAGYDFMENQTLLEANCLLTPKSLGMIASGGHASVMVHKAPKIALLATGDELVPANQKEFLPHQTVSSTTMQLQALITDCGATCIDLGHAGDTLHALKTAISKAGNADILVTIGGASVGDKDLIQQALHGEGMALNFWKIAMKPGKPMIFGKRGKQYILGLPGNPASAFVCALIYLRPLIDKLMGRPAPLPSGVNLPVATDLAENGPRQDYMRARLLGMPGERHVDPAVSQDSGHLSVMAHSDGLIIRPPHAPAVTAGELVPFLPF